LLQDDSHISRKHGPKFQDKKKDAPTTGDVEGASVEELNQKIMTLEKEKNKEEEYRNYMQLERVRLCAYHLSPRCMGCNQPCLARIN
jgi:hypothetical protein